MPDGTEFNRKSKSKISRQEDKRQSRREGYKGRPQFDVVSIDLRAFILCLEQVTAKQGALRVGLSRDGGALAIGIYGDGDPYTEYIDSPDDTAEYFSGLAEYFANL